MICLRDGSGNPFSLRLRSGTGKKIGTEAKRQPDLTVGRGRPTSFYSKKKHRMAGPAFGGEKVGMGGVLIIAGCEFTVDDDHGVGAG